jgi:hypothetical protein
MAHLNVPTAQVDNDMTVVLPISGFPVSGTAGTGAGVYAAPGCLIRDTGSGVIFVNEGTLASPYWTPVSFNQQGLVGLNTDWNGASGRAGSATTDNSIDTNGVKYFGQGIEVNDADTAMTVSYPIGGPLLTFGTTNEANHSSSLGLGGTAGLWKPGTNGTMVVDIVFTAITDILTRAFILGFQGDANGAQEEALDPILTGSTTTLTFSAVGSAGDNLAGLIMDSRLTAASSLFAFFHKADAAASQTTTAAACDVASTIPAAATYCRLRVEIDSLGNMYCFKDKALIATKALALTAATAHKPVFQMVNTTTTASLQCGIRRFGAWAKR